MTQIYPTKATEFDYFYDEPGSLPDFSRQVLED